MGRGVTSTEDSVSISIRHIENDIKRSKERLIIVTRNNTNNPILNSRRNVQKIKI